MTALTTTAVPNLPAHLQKFSGLALGAAITGGIKSGGHPTIGIKGGKWRLKEGGAEDVLDTLKVDVVIVDANQYMSKVYYASKYNPKSEEYLAPDCFSDNGQGPSTQATLPQSTSCATCPKNVWGSKINELGNKTKACADYKKLAVVLADDISRNVYELRIPPASLQDLNKIMTKLTNNRIPIPALVFELSFDANVEYPKIQFKPTNYLTDLQANEVEKWVNSAEAKEAVGSLDLPVQHVVAATPSYQAPVVPPLVVPQPEPKKEAFLENVLGSGSPSEEPVKRGRGRPAKSQEAKVSHTEETQLSMDIPGLQTAAKATPVNPTLTDKGLDELLAGIL